MMKTTSKERGDLAETVKVGLSTLTSKSTFL